MIMNDRMFLFFTKKRGGGDGKTLFYNSSCGLCGTWSISRYYTNASVTQTTREAEKDESNF